MAVFLNVWNRNVAISYDRFPVTNFMEMMVELLGYDSNGIVKMVLDDGDGSPSYACAYDYYENNYVAAKIDCDGDHVNQYTNKNTHHVTKDLTAFITHVSAYTPNFISSDNIGTSFSSPVTMDIAQDPVNTSVGSAAGSPIGVLRNHNYGYKNYEYESDVCVSMANRNVL